VAVGEPAEQILRVAREEKADLIVMGTHGRRGWRHAVLGSVAEAVMRQAMCPVLTVRTAGR
jgi:nucleotide-binding universal stress UspA family protein